MAYKDNVQTLCDRLGIPNPIPERRIGVAGLVFDGVPGFEDGFLVEATDMNRAGRLFVHELLGLRRLPHLEGIDKEKCATFFTPELWDDCGPERRTLVYGLKTATRVSVLYKSRRTSPDAL